MARPPTKGWKKEAPRLVSERRAVAKRCGAARAFLVPEKLAFPVVPRKGTCKPSCAGLAAAFARARQLGRRKVAKKAIRLACRVGCEWTKRAERC